MRCMEYSVSATTRRSAVSNWRDSMRQPVFNTRCQTSIVHLHVYQCTRSIASFTLGVGNVVKRSHSMAFSPFGGEVSVARTPHRLTVPSRFLACGGLSVIGRLRRDSLHWRIGSPSRRGAHTSIVPSTLAVCNVSHRYRCGLSTTRFHETRTSNSTPAGRPMANNSNTSASRSPTLTKVVSGQASRAATSASTLSSHLTLSLSSSGRFLCDGNVPNISSSCTQLRCASSPNGNRSGVTAKVL